MNSLVAGRRFSRVSVFLILALCACGGGGSSTSNGVTDPPAPPPPPPPPSGSTSSLTVTNNKFTPKLDSVAVGAMLTWTWNTCTGDGYGGSTCSSHSVTFDDGPSSPTQDSGEFSRMFATAGTFTYHCKVHGAAMTGTVVVH